MEATSECHPQLTCLDRIVPMCELCRRVYDEGQTDEPATTWPGSAWVDLRTFFRGRTMHHAQVVFARAYCDDCRRSYELVTQYREYR